MAPVTCDTQAYFNILFPSISFFFLSYFFVLLQNLSPLLFAIFEVPRIASGVGRGNANKVPYGQFEDSEFTFRWSELAALNY